ncbi:antibiotic biosynthesis monooxygenase [Arthrobacter sp. StoSoilB22]|uniref:antibiotic biosynthesis monooxygenase family protein n=1 Tax=Arthrobacter sp. StoSoilB22 TaxID=2830996 RepID=UPI001CC4A679|nr:antibiotic biosynthesis monooxygenase [Arthrobacter sp. StoSoilB22]BCW62841.1 antibiotic biosynthesis monooxygenase [Arthrobacter sp. StoSoilB22]
MIHEIATLTITPGFEADFEAAAAKAVPLFQKAKGALSWRLERTIETPNEYTLTVGWETLEDHTVGFRESADFQQWRELVGPHFAAPPQVKHTQHTYQGF